MASLFDDDTPTTLNQPLPRVGTLPAIPPRLIRICLIVTGHFTEDKNDVYDTYLAWLQNSLPQNTNVKFLLDPWEAQEQSYPSREGIQTYDAVLISGSPADASSSDEWVIRLMTFIQIIATKHHKIKIYGVCFGSQIIARTLGGTVERNNGIWEIGVTHVQTTYMGKLLFGVQDLNLMQFNQDHVVFNSLSDFLAKGELYLLGSTQRTSIQGIVKFYPYNQENDKLATELINRVHIMTTQGHPEFTEKISSDILRRRHGKGEVSDQGFQEYFGSRGNLSDMEPVVKTDTGKRWLGGCDGVHIVGRTFWRMLGVDYGNEHPPKIPA